MYTSFSMEKLYQNTLRGEPMLEQIGYVLVFWIGFIITIAVIIAAVRKDHGENPDAVKVHRFGKDAGLIAVFGVILSVSSPYTPEWWEIIGPLFALGAALAVAWRKEKESQTVQ